MQIKVDKEGDIYRLVVTDEKGTVTLGRRFPDVHSAERTRQRYLRWPDKLAVRVAAARGEVEKVRTAEYVPVEQDQTEG